MITKFDIEILQEHAGEREARPWGAAVGASLEYLRGSGYISGPGVTDKGRAVLDSQKKEPSFLNLDGDYNEVD